LGRRLRVSLGAGAPVGLYRRWRARLKALVPKRVLLVLSIVGPGIITADDVISMLRHRD
jgi:hypothetical protein